MSIEPIITSTIHERNMSVSKGKNMWITYFSYFNKILHLFTTIFMSTQKNVHSFFGWSIANRILIITSGVLKELGKDYVLCQSDFHLEFLCFLELNHLC